MISDLEKHILRSGARRSCRLGAATAALLATTLLAAAGSSSGSIKTDPALATAPATPLVLINGTLIDGTGAKPVKNAVVLIKGKRIVFAGPRGKIAIPARARRIDVHGGTILPGFINTHVHNAFDDKTLRRWLLGGVTTVRDLSAGTDYESAFSFRDEANRSSRTARLLVAGPMITATGGYPEATSVHPGLEVSSVADARAKVERLIEAGCDTVKVTLESGEIFGRLGIPELSVAEVRAIVAVAHRHHLRVSAHAMVTADVKRAVEGGVDEIAHTDVQNTPQGLIKRMVADRIDWVPTFELLHVVGLGTDGDGFARFVRAGGVVALGTDYEGAPGRFDLGMPIRELKLMEQFGMTPMQVIKAATGIAAYAIDHPELGVLKTGKIADVIAVKGNPLKDLNVLTKTRLVVHNGTVALNKLG